MMYISGDHTTTIQAETVLRSLIIPTEITKLDDTKLFTQFVLDCTASTLFFNK